MASVDGKRLVFTSPSAIGGDCVVVTYTIDGEQKTVTFKGEKEWCLSGKVVETISAVTIFKFEFRFGFGSVFRRKPRFRFSFCSIEPRRFIRFSHFMARCFRL